MSEQDFQVEMGVTPEPYTDPMQGSAPVAVEEPNTNSDALDADPTPTEGKKPRIPSAKGRVRGVSRLKRETRFGLAALLSFVILITALLLNKWGGSGMKGSGPPSLKVPGPNTAAKDNDDSKKSGKKKSKKVAAADSKKEGASKPDSPPIPEEPKLEDRTEPATVEALPEVNKEQEAEKPASGDAVAGIEDVTPLPSSLGAGPEAGSAQQDLPLPKSPLDGNPPLPDPVATTNLDDMPGSSTLSGPSNSEQPKPGPVEAGASAGDNQVDLPAELPGVVDTAGTAEPSQEKEEDPSLPTPALGAGGLMPGGSPGAAGLPDKGLGALPSELPAPSAQDGLPPIGEAAQPAATLPSPEPGPSADAGSAGSLGLPDPVGAKPTGPGDLDALMQSPGTGQPQATPEIPSGSPTEDPSLPSPASSPLEEGPGGMALPEPQPAPAAEPSPAQGGAETGPAPASNLNLDQQSSPQPQPQPEPEAEMTSPGAAAPVRPNELPSFDAAPTGDAPIITPSPPPSLKPGEGVLLPTLGKKGILGGRTFATDAGSSAATSSSVSSGLSRSDSATETPPPGEDRLEQEIHVVKSGENFYTISQDYYGSGRYYMSLWKANKHTVSAPERLRVGQVIVIPPPDKLDPTMIQPARVARSGADQAPDSPVRRASNSTMGGEERVPESGEAEVLLPIDHSTLRRQRELARAQDDSFAIDPSPDRRPVASGPRYRVRPYETLRSIARDQLGDPRRDKEIFELNRDVLDEYRQPLVSGQVLKLPADARD